MRPGLIGIVMTVAMVGCNKSPNTVEVTSSVDRAARRAYDGAPPVIPHKTSTAACASCHAATGKTIEGMGVAPANPHLQTDQTRFTANCEQCHMSVNSKKTFAANVFQGLRKNRYQGDRMYHGAPPVMPHSTLMRENCLACHAGKSARAEIRCSHPERSNCRQCHMTREVAISDAWPKKSSP